jgi:hypothetical protein
MRDLVQHTLLGIAVGLCGASGNTLHWVLVYAVAPRATYFSGYGSCWFMWGTVVGYKCMLRHGQHTLLGILSLVYDGPLPTHFIGYCCGLCEVSGNTLYWPSLGLTWGPFINGFKIIYSLSVGFLISSEMSPHKQNHMTLLPCFLINLINLHLPQQSGGRVYASY